jgi:hypothetical protein
MTQALHQPFRALMDRISYRHAIPFIVSAILAVVTTGWSGVFGSTSIWTFAILALAATVFTLLYGGRFRTFFIVIAVVPPFLFMLSWYLRMRSAMVYLPTNAFLQFFLYFVAAPILVVWGVTTLLGRTERQA